MMLYALDADGERTASLGILNYTRCLIQAMSNQSDPGFDLLILVSSRNQSVVLPGTLPSWVRAEVVEGRFGSGLKRLWADHVLSVRWARRLGAGLVFFPKGWLPLAAPQTMCFMATMHDTMSLYYLEHYPGHILRAKTLYWIWNMRRTCARADGVTTISHFSKHEILKLGVRPRRDIQVVYPGPGIESKRPAVTPARQGLLVLGSRYPHKATCETLFLLDAYSRHIQADILVYVTGLSEWPAEWGAPPPTLRPRFLGRISDSELSERYSSAEVLVFLSQMEGFGLPLLEALAHGAAVCFRASHAVREVFGEGPGAWDGSTDMAFFAALTRARQMSAGEIQQWHARVDEKANWTLCARKHLELFGEQLGVAPSRMVHPVAAPRHGDD